MTDNSNRLHSRRSFLKDAGRVAAASALAGLVVPHVYASEDNTIQIALVGCGGRGTGAAVNALSAQNGPVKLVAMADVFPDRLTQSFAGLKQTFGDKVNLPEDRKFIGFDAYKKAMDCLKPGDIAIFATPPAFRWVHFSYAIDKDLNVFMEKPVTVDGPTTRRMLQLADKATQKNLKVAVGLMWRHCRVRRALNERIRNGEIGDVLITLRAYRMHGPIGSFLSPPKPDNMTDLEYQIRRFHSFLWASGGCYSDFYIHNIDECCWMKGEWPVEAQATGGRHYRGENVDQNFDNYSVEYTFADGTKFFLYGRCIPRATISSEAMCTAASGRRSSRSMRAFHRGTAIYKAQKLAKSEITWKWTESRGAKSVSSRMGGFAGRGSAGQAVQRGQTRCRGKPRHVHGAYGGTYRSEDHA